jgi:toxin YoeB
LAEKFSKFQIRFSKKAQKDIAALSDQQKQKLKSLLDEVISVNSHTGKSLKGNLKGLYSYRLNLKDRILYEIYEQDKTIFVIRTRAHYGD